MVGDAARRADHQGAASGQRRAFGRDVRAADAGRDPRAGAREEPGEFVPHLRREFTEFLKLRGKAEKSECYIPMTVGDLIRSGQAKCQVLRSAASWFGVTYREDRPHVVQSIQGLISKGQYPEKLWS